MAEESTYKKVKRSQDIWNERHGLVSKSYKLYKSVIENFADACRQNGVSQAGQLTELITNYTITTKRRSYIMYIQEKYSKNSDIEKILQQKLDEAVKQISADDIEQFLDNYYKDKIQGKRFGKLYDIIEYNHRFRAPKEIDEYVNEGAVEITEYAVKILKTQISLSMLIADKKLMPTGLRQNFKTELNVDHNHGNTLFDLVVDVLPYESYLIIDNK